MPPTTPTLLSIPPSHYCEKARWGLDRAGIAYREERHLPMFSRLAGRRRGVWHTVPILFTDAQAISDSTAILHWADEQAPGVALYPSLPEARKEVEALEEAWDDRFGPHPRRLVYFHLLDHKELLLSSLGDGAPPAEVKIISALYPVFRRLIVRGLKVNEEGAARSLSRIHAVFDEVGARLADGRRYLCGDRFTAADLTFASLAALIVVPQGFGAALPRPEEAPPAFRSLVESLRATPAGEFVMRLYREERAARSGAKVSTTA